MRWVTFPIRALGTNIIGEYFTFGHPNSFEYSFDSISPSLQVVSPGMSNKRRGRRGRGGKPVRLFDAVVQRSLSIKHVGGSASSARVVETDAADNQLQLTATPPSSLSGITVPDSILATNERFAVHWLMCGDGNARNGVRFDRGVVYANSILRLKSWGSFWALAWDDDILIGLPPEGCTFSAALRGDFLSVLESDSLVVPRFNGPGQNDSDVRRHYERHICAWLSEHSGWVLNLSRNGAREARAIDPNQYIERWEVITYHGVHDCAVAATIDSVHLVSGIENACEAIRLAGNTPKRTIRFESASALLDKLRIRAPGIRLKKLSVDEEREIRSGGSRGSLLWLVRDRRSVFLVILASESCIHSVAVDTRPLRRIIVDSQEPFAISLSVRNLQHCGIGANVHVRAVRRVVIPD